MKKHLILTSLIAIVATTGMAKAASDLTFDGHYALATDAEGVKSGSISNEPQESDFKYEYKTFDGTTETVHDNVSYDSETTPDYANIKYLNSNGDAIAYTEDAEFEDAQAYKKSVNAERSITMKEGEPDEYILTIKTSEAGQTLVANGELSKENYIYQAEGGQEFNLSQQPTFNEEYTLLTGADEKIAYAGAEDPVVVSATNGQINDEFELNGENYILHASNGLDFRLTEDGTGYRRISDGGTVEPASDYSDYIDEFTALKAAYDADKLALKNIKDNTQADYDAVKDDYEAALDMFKADEITVGNLTSAFESQEKAAGFYADASKAYADAGKNYETSHESYENASKLYHASIAETIEGGANEAIAASVEEGGVVKAAIDDAKNYADEQIASENTKLHGKIHGLITADENGVKTFNGTNATASTRIDEEGHYVGDLAVGTTTEDHLVSLDNAIGAEVDRAMKAEAAIRDEFAAADALTLQQAKAYADAGNSLTLNKANAYTDSKVNTLEKNISGGVAAATALSSVAVSNVGKGEVSVGGGYGYYNHQSAAAFGAAMGLTDRWSINAGAGIASGDKTQYTFRAGTNYKFKLF